VTPRTIVWFRGKDLRLSDHAPLYHALERGDVIPLFVLDPFFFTPEAAQKLPHRIQFLLESLHALSNNIRAKGSELVLVVGRSVDVIPKLAATWGVNEVVAHRWTEPFGRVRDAKIAKLLTMPFSLFEGETLTPPGTVRTGEGKPFSVFTPFANAFRRAVNVERPLGAPPRLPPLPPLENAEGVFFSTHSDTIPTLEALGLKHNPKLQPGGEKLAQQRLRDFVAERLQRYADERDRMDLQSTSRLSADLKFGTLSVRKVWHAVMAARLEPGLEQARVKYSTELLWREFSHHCLWHRPELLEQPFRKEFNGFPWKPASGEEWQAWVTGNTGYPIVDAAARQLLEEGFVHNRARMIAASFLTKHLLIDYRGGEAHYLEYLTDGDWAQNNAGWQWSAGCGCDAQPYYRVFNPVTQGSKFDPKGEYVQRYLPELANVQPRYIHSPWSAPASELLRSGVRLGIDYPKPIVDHDLARKRFLSLAESFVKRKPE
jgi:deoxyribodipyrimidine photo-lyase